MRGIGHSLLDQKMDCWTNINNIKIYVTNLWKKAASKPSLSQLFSSKGFQRAFFLFETNSSFLSLICIIQRTGTS